MEVFDENNNEMQNNQETEIIIDTDNNFADYRYDNDMVIEENNINDKEQTIDSAQFDNTKDNHENTQDSTINETIQPTITKEQEINENKENFKNNNLDFLNKKIEKIDNLADRDHEANTKKQQFETEFKDINDILEMSNQLDNTIDNNNDKDNKRDTKGLGQKPKNLDKEKENLDKALDNLIKVRSLA